MRIALSTFGTAVALALGFAGGHQSVNAQEYPTETVRLVVPFAAGGSSDTIARLLTEPLGETLGGNFIVENMPGAGTLIATTHVKNAPPDGHTLLVADVPFTVNPAVTQDADYDPRSDFTPIAIVGASSQFMYSRPDRFDSATDLIDEARSNPGTVSAAHAGIGTTTHLMTLMFADGADIELTEVPYSGSAPALTDTAAGHTDIAFSTLASAASLVDAGELHVLATTASDRLDNLPNVPTFVELGVDDLVIEHWWGILGPADMPEPIVEALNEAISDAISRDDVQQRLDGLRVEPRSATPEEFGAIIEEYTHRWEEVVEQHGIARE